MVIDIPGVRGIAYGGDFYPEQWSAETLVEDARLMRQAGVTMVTVGVFAWAWLEPEPGRYTFDWLDRVLDTMAEHGIAVDLATATASPPPWFSAANPASMPVDAAGHRLWYGSRQAVCPSSLAYRTAALALVEQLATRYAAHQALVLWHVNNEYGCHVPRCWCDASAQAFRGWLRRRHGDLDALNAAWGTAFWSQRYTDWAQVLPPRETPSFANPTQQLDFHRFSSDELIDCYRAERDLLRRLSPGIPVTTNIMAGMSWELDYWAWADETDLVATDHYLVAEAEGTAAQQIAFGADLTRSLARGRPWLLMEHATSAVNWQPRNLAKAPGLLRRDSLARVARGADGLLFFQWRASRAGAEKWHSGMVPHAGTDTKIFREVVALGGELADLGDLAGSTVRADVAILLDWSSIWAQRHPSQPSVDLDPVALTGQWHAALREAGFTCDFARPGGDLSGYRLVCVPALYLVDDAGAAGLVDFVARGGTALVGPFSGVVDEHDQVRLGGYPGAWRELLGVLVEEHHPLPAGATLAVDPVGAAGDGPVPGGAAGRLWSEQAGTTTADTLARYAGGPLAGAPALTSNRFGAGVAAYLTTHPDRGWLRALLGWFAASAGVAPAVAGLPAGVDAVVREHADGRRWTFLISDADGAVDLDLPGEIVTGAERTVAGALRLPAGGLAVVRGG